MESICVSSPGKIIIHGEHAVVYGKKALAASLDLRTYLKIESTSKNIDVHALFPDIDVERTWNIDSLLEKIQPISPSATPSAELNSHLLSQLTNITGVPYHSDTKHMALVAFLYLYVCIGYRDGTLPSMRIEIKSLLPTGAGLGSSAAFSTCLAAGFLLHRGNIKTLAAADNESHMNKQWSSHDLELINKWAFQAERIIHGNPSGIDNSVSTYGGALTFCGGKITPNTLPRINIILFNTKQPRSTKQLVANVKEKYNKFPEVLEPILCSMEAIVEKSTSVLSQNKDSLSKESFTTLKELVEMNQSLLELIGVSHAKLATICQIGHKHGLSAKLTGAGGGGCAFTLLPPDVKPEVVEACIADAQSVGFDARQTTFGGPGTLQHHPLDCKLPFSS